MSKDEIVTVTSVPETFKVTWEEGQQHPEYPVSAGSKEGTWVPNAGYSWALNPKGPHDVIWVPGQEHPDYPHVISGPSENDWVPAAGYTWKIKR